MGNGEPHNMAGRRGARKRLVGSACSAPERKEIANIALNLNFDRWAPNSALRLAAWPARGRRRPETRPGGHFEELRGELPTGTAAFDGRSITGLHRSGSRGGLFTGAEGSRREEEASGVGAGLARPVTTRPATPSTTTGKGHHSSHRLRHVELCDEHRGDQRHQGKGTHPSSRRPKGRARPVQGVAPACALHRARSLTPEPERRLASITRTEDLAGMDSGPSGGTASISSQRPGTAWRCRRLLFESPWWGYCPRRGRSISPSWR